MITDADTKKLLKAFKEVFLTKDDAKNFATKDDAKNFATKDDLKNFPTKADLKDQLNDQKAFILDAVDGKLAIQKREILEEVNATLDIKLAKQKTEIVKEVATYVADTIVPMFDERDQRLDRLEKMIPPQPLAD